MLKGHYFLWLPLLYSILIPGILLYNASTLNVSFFHWALIIVAACLVVTNLVLFRQFSFVKKTNSEILQNALRGKNLFKYVVIISVVFTVVSGASLNVLDYHNSIVLEEQKIDYPALDLKRFFFFWFYSMIFSLWSPLILIFIIDYNLSKTYAYFIIGLHEKDSSDKINYYQNGIESYNKFLSETFGKKLKHFEEIESYLLSEKTEKTDVMIRSLLNEFDEPIQLARRLDSWVSTSDPKILNKTNMSEIFKTNRPYEISEKWFKIIGAAIPTSIGLILFWVTKSGNP